MLAKRGQGQALLGKGVGGGRNAICFKRRFLCGQGLPCAHMLVQELRMTA